MFKACSISGNSVPSALTSMTSKWCRSAPCRPRGFVRSASHTHTPPIRAALAHGHGKPNATHASLLPLPTFTRPDVGISQSVFRIQNARARPFDHPLLQRPSLLPLQSEAGGKFDRFSSAPAHAAHLAGKVFWGGAFREKAKKCWGWNFGRNSNLWGRGGTNELGSHVIAEPPDHLVRAVPGWSVPGNEQHEFVGRVETKSIDPHAPAGNVGDEAVAWWITWSGSGSSPDVRGGSAAPRVFPQP